MTNSLNGNSTGRILIVDDNESVRETLEAFLYNQGYELIFAENGATGLEKAQEHAPDLIILDVMMPDMDGFEVCRRLRKDKALAEVPVIFATALDDDESRMNAMDADGDDFLTKPIDRLELRARVRSILRLNRYRKLTDERQKFQHLFERLPIGVFLTDKEGNVHLANPALYRLFGIDPESNEEGLNLKGCLPEGCLEKFFGQEKESQNLEAKITTFDERELIADVTLSRMEWDSTTMAQVLVADLTARKKAEQQLLQAQRMESIGALAGGIAHDLNNILAPVRIATGMLCIDDNLKKEQKNYLNIIDGCIERAAGVVTQILAFARGVDSQKNAVKPHLLLKELGKVMEETFPKNIKLITETDEKLPMFKGDSAQIYQVLLNLCINARDAMPDGGRLILKGGSAELDDTFLSTYAEREPGPYVTFEVSDTGCGIPTQNLENIFEPLFTTKDEGKGTGLGLATTRKIVDDHEGIITVKSEVNEGTIFKVYLPASEDGQEENESSDSKETSLPQGNNELILYVDDEAVILETAQYHLKQCNYRVLTAKDGFEALALAAKHGEELGLIITDLRMPDLDGVGLARALKNLNPNFRIVGSTGLATTEEVKRWGQAGVLEVLEKPYTTRQLIATVQRNLSNKADWRL